MLLLKSNCECCDRDLLPDSRDAMICSFECTVCRACVENALKERCPNCGGEFVPQPIRPPWELVNNPASTERYFKRQGRAGAAS